MSKNNLLRLAIDVLKELPPGAVYADASTPSDAQISANPSGRGRGHWFPKQYAADKNKKLAGAGRKESPISDDLKDKGIKDMIFSQMDISEKEKESFSEYYDKLAKVTDKMSVKELDNGMKESIKSASEYKKENIILASKVKEMRRRMGGESDPTDEGIEVLERLYDNINANKIKIKKENLTRRVLQVAKVFRQKYLPGDEPVSPKEQVGVGNKKEQIRGLRNEVKGSWKNLSEEEQGMNIAAHNNIERYQKIFERLKKEMENGSYDRKTAEKLATKVMNDVNKDYKYQTGKSYSSKQRQNSAAHWVKEFESDYAEGKYDPGGDWYERIRGER